MVSAGSSHYSADISHNVRQVLRDLQVGSDPSFLKQDHFPGTVAGGTSELGENVPKIHFPRRQMNNTGQNGISRNFKPADRRLDRRTNATVVWGLSAPISKLK